MDLDQFREPMANVSLEGHHARTQCFIALRDLPHQVEEWARLGFLQPDPVAAIRIEIRWGGMSVRPLTAAELTLIAIDQATTALMRVASSR